MHTKAVSVNDACGDDTVAHWPEATWSSDPVVSTMGHRGRQHPLSSNHYFIITFLNIIITTHSLCYYCYLNQQYYCSYSYHYNAAAARALQNTPQFLHLMALNQSRAGHCFAQINSHYICKKRNIKSTTPTCAVGKNLKFVFVSILFLHCHYFIVLL